MTFISIKRKIKTLSLVYCLLLAIGFAFGWLGFLIFGDVAGACRVVVVSKAAILEFERERVKLEDGSYNSKNLFFGNQREFIDLIVNYANSYKDKRTKVVLVSDETGNVLGAENITPEIYFAAVKYQELNKQAAPKRVISTTAKELVETPE